MPYVSTNPSNTSDVVTEIELGTSRTFVDAARRAKAAQRAWARVPAPVRGQVIGNIGRLVEANFEPLAQLVTREIGKPIAEARGEVQEIVDTCNFFVGEGRRLYGHTVPSEMADKQQANSPSLRTLHPLVAPHTGHGRSGDVDAHSGRSATRA